jgi:hypothetical protein
MVACESGIGEVSTMMVFSDHDHNGAIPRATFSRCRVTHKEHTELRPQAVLVAGHDV